MQVPELYVYTVMPFGLVNAPATFQATINHIFRDMLDRGVLEFMDEIVIHAPERPEHDEITLEVLESAHLVPGEESLWVCPPLSPAVLLLIYTL